jgi:uroporphyrinogen decarboxylase
MQFEQDAPPPRWEFGYWGATVDRWYEEGLERRDYPQVEPPALIEKTPTSRLYLPAWRRGQHDGRLPRGIAIMAGGLYWPSQGFPLDFDVRRQLGMDPPQTLVNVNMLFSPMFDVQVLKEDERLYDYIDIDGVRRLFLKEEATIPTAMGYPIRSRADWEKLKAERLRTDTIRDRFPANWPDLVKEYRHRDYPLALGGYPHGFFGTLVHLMGYEELFVNFYDQPDLIHDILDTFTDLWIAVYEEVVKDVEVDHIQIWEDISAGTGSMVSPALIREFMLPRYKRLTGFVKSKGIKHVFVDTDGDCFDLIPLFLEGGATGMYPMEASCGMDIVKVRKAFPRLQMLGGVPKAEIARGPARIDSLLEPVEAVLKTGGYIPFGDHFIPPDVSWNDFVYYRKALNRLTSRGAS